METNVQEITDKLVAAVNTQLESIDEPSSTEINYTVTAGTLTASDINKPDSSEVSPEAKQAKADYMREYMRDYMKEYRRKNPAQIKETQKRYWENKVRRKRKMSELKGITFMTQDTEAMIDVLEMQDRIKYLESEVEHLNGHISLCLEGMSWKNKRIIELEAIVNDTRGNPCNASR